MLTELIEPNGGNVRLIFAVHFNVGSGCLKKKVEKMNKFNITN